MTKEWGRNEIGLVKNKWRKNYEGMKYDEVIMKEGRSDERNKKEWRIKKE